MVGLALSKWYTAYSISGPYSYSVTVYIPLEKGICMASSDDAKITELTSQKCSLYW